MTEINLKAGSLTRWQHLRGRIRLFRNWYKTVLPLNRFFDRPTLMVLRDGSRVWVRSVFSGDLSIAEGVIFRNEYRLDVMNLPENALIYDLGANIGTFSIAARRACPSARIVAYEPDEANFAMLVRNAPFAKLHQEAIAGETGVVHFDTNAHPQARRILESGGITVPARSLQDAIGDEKVDLLKLDIEGAEFDVIERTDPSLFKSIDRIVMETHGLGDWGERRLRSLGYKTRWFWQQNLGLEHSNDLIYGERLNR